MTNHACRIGQSGQGTGLCLAAAAARWDPAKYFSDPSYYNDPKLVRPYRLGMSCGFCRTSRASPSRAWS